MTITIYDEVRELLQLVVSVEEMAHRYRQSPEEVYGEMTMAEHPEWNEAGKRFCWHQPNWPCSECVGHAMLAIGPTSNRLRRLVKALEDIIELCERSDAHPELQIGALAHEALKDIDSLGREK